MTNNLIVTFDLMSPGQNYERVHERIKSLGNWYQFQYSAFYLNTGMSPEHAHAAIWEVMDANDRLAIIHAQSIVMTPAAQADLDAINQVWFAAA